MNQKHNKHPRLRNDKQRVLKMTLQTAMNPLGGVPSTHLLRKFRGIAREHTEQIREMYAMPYENVTLEHLETLSALSSDLHALSMGFREIGNRLNPFLEQENDAAERKTIDWVDFYDYQQMVDFYLTVAYPNYPRDRFYGWFSSQIIDKSSNLKMAATFLLTLKQRNIFDKASYDEIIRLSHINLWQIEAIVDAAANYEVQVFSEDT